MEAELGEKSEISALVEGGYSWQELVEAMGSERTTAKSVLENSTLKMHRLLDIGAPVHVLAKCAASAEGSRARLKELLAAGVYVRTLLDGGWQLRTLVDEGVRLRALANAGIDSSSFIQLGLSAKSLLAEGLPLGSFVLPSGTRFLLPYYHFRFIADREVWVVEDFLQGGLYKVRPSSSGVRILMDMREMLKHGLMLI